ncbi:hypothetical protein FOL46_000956, partial [Perkinsus olseni]
MSLKRSLRVPSSAGFSVPSMWLYRALDVVVAEKSVTKEMMYHGQEEADARATMVDVQDFLGFGQHALAGIDADVDREVEVDTVMDCETTTSVGWYGRVPAVFELRTTLADEAREEVLAGQDVVRTSYVRFLRSVDPRLDWARLDGGRARCHPRRRVGSPRQAEVWGGVPTHHAGELKEPTLLAHLEVRAYFVLYAEVHWRSRRIGAHTRRL